MKRRRLLALAVAPAVALVGTGTAYAVWTLTLNSSGTVNTAKLADPAALTTDATSTAAVIKWTVPTTAADSKATYMATASAPGKTTRTCSAAATGGSCPLTGLEPSTEYTVGVQATLHSWKSGTPTLSLRTAEAADVTAPVTVISAPAADRSVIAGSAAIPVSGEATDVNPANTTTTVVVQRATAASPTDADWSDVAGTTGTATGTSKANTAAYSFSPTTAGTYQFRIKGTDGAGNSATSPVRTITVQPAEDTSSPVVTGVISSSVNGSYKAGQVVPIQVTFDKTVNVTGTPRLALAVIASPGRLVDYSSGSGTSTLTFNYTVLAGDNSADLNYTGTNALTLNGGTIKNAAGAQANATLTLPATSAPNSLGGSKAIVIDTVSPALTMASCGITQGSNYACSGTYGLASGDSGELAATLKVKSTGAAHPGSMVKSGANTWTYSGQSLTSGVTMVFTITQVDAAGNSTTQSAEFTR